jgi:methionyl-tRNA formyltransferase
MAAAREDVEVVAVVDAAYRPPSSSPLRAPAAIARWGARRAFNLNTGAAPAAPLVFSTCASLTRRHRIPLLAPREGGVNDGRLVEQLRALRPDATIGLMVGQIFKRPLLESCRAPINYHDGLLPDFRGVAATSWSIYCGARRSGFTFHVMTETVDGGPILLQDAVPLGPKAAAWPTERAKTRLACSRLDELFELLAAGTESAEPQADRGSSFSRAELRGIRTVLEPGKLPLAELELRLRAFEALDLTLAGESVNTTALRRVRRRPHHRRLEFTSADGVRLETSRISHLPPAVSRARAFLRSG